MHEQIITVYIQDESRRRWLLSVVYASTYLSLRDELWDYIRKLGGIIDMPWTLLGDFNQPLCVADKYGGRLISNNRIVRMQCMIDECGLIDLGFTGPKCTWTNMRAR